MYLTKSKLQELKVLIEESKPKIIALTEVFPKNRILDLDTKIFEIPEYDIFINNIENNRGVLIYISKSLDPTKVEITTVYKGVIGCKITLKDHDSLYVHVYCIYRSPSRPEEHETLDKLFTEICKNKSHVLIMGDLI